MNEDTVLNSFPIRNVPDGPGLFRGISGNFNSFSQIVNEFVDDSISSYRASNTPLDRRIVDIALENLGGPVAVTVRDGGSGIEDLAAALTIADTSQAQTALNVYGMGMKHALASVDASGTQDWSIRTRTKEDEEANRYREVTGPYDIDRMTCDVKSGNGDIVDGTGTRVWFRCPAEMFHTLKPKNRRTEPAFGEYVAYLVEELRYTYAPLLAAGELQFTVSAYDGAADCFVVDAPLEPHWTPGTLRKLPDIPVDLGCGEVVLRIRYGEIDPSKENALYYKGTMPTSGIELRLNGRLIERGLYEEVFHEKLHNSQNHYIAQVDIIYDDARKVPPAKPSKTGFVKGHPMLEALYACIRTNVEKPKKDADTLEAKLVKQLKEKLDADPEVVRATMEEPAYESLGLKTSIDLFVSRRDRVVLYEAKAYGSKSENLYQLMMYWDGCVRDGKPAQEGILIAKRHPKEVRMLLREMNQRKDTRGVHYNFRLSTWAEEGVGSKPDDDKDPTEEA